MKFYSLLMVVIILGLFLVGIGAVIAATEQSTTASVTVDEFLSITLTSGYPVTFGSIDPAVTTDATVDPLVSTVGSETNVNVNVTTKTNQTNFVSGSNTFAVGNMTWSVTDEGGEVPYKNSSAVVCSSISGGSACNIYHEITIPSAQTAGTYNVGITITATKA